MIRRAVLFVFVLSLASGLLTGCGNTSSATTSTEHPLNMAPMSQLPDDVKSAPVVTQQAYQFAVANPDVMKQVPCYCGCGSMGHTSSYSCYVQGADAGGNLKFDSHAIGCSICVDITQDTMRLLKQGKSPQDIHTYVDKTYSRFGPSNMK